MRNIAHNTFREIIRNKLLYVIVFFASVFIIFSLALGKLTLGENDKVIIDFGLAMIEVFGLITVLFVGSQLLFKEIEGKTIFLILSKPIRRYEFIIGKFLGFSLVIFIIVALQSAVFLGLLYFRSIPIDSLILFALVFTLFKLLIILSLVFFFSTFMSTLLTIMVTVMVYILSHSYSIVVDLLTTTNNTSALMGVKAFGVFFPPFEALNIKDVIGTFANFPPNYFVLNTFYSLAYLLLVLFLTVVIFEKKTFER